MGGASAQIAFEVPIDGISIPKEQPEDNENIELVNIGCRDDDKSFLYRIFVTTFLGFGVNEGAKKYEHFLWMKLRHENENVTNKNVNTTSLPIISAISDGCLPVNFLKVTNIEEQDEKQFVRKVIRMKNQKFKLILFSREMAIGIGVSMILQNW